LLLLRQAAVDAMRSMCVCADRKKKGKNAAAMGSAAAAAAAASLLRVEP
jgi:2-methylcitrate dehydratase PrpD